MKEKKSEYGNTKDWTTIISGVGQGAGSAIKGRKEYSNSKRELREAKRKTLSNLLNNAIKRNKSLFRTGQEHSNEMNEFQSQRMQQMARGFVDALHGSTHR